MPLSQFSYWCWSFVLLFITYSACTVLRTVLGFYYNFYFREVIVYGSSFVLRASVMHT